MTDETLFSTTATNPVDLLVGEGKKFRTIEDLAKAKLESDTFIQRLQDENKGIREDLNQRVRMEQLLERLEEQSGEGTERTDTNQSQNSRPDDSPNIETLIEQTLTKREADRRVADNFAKVESALRQYFGDDYKAKLEARVTSLGLNKAVLDNLAKQDPALFLKAVEVTDTTSRQEPTVQLPNTSRLSTVAPTTGSGQRSYKDYQALRKADPATYWKPDVQLQLHKDAIAAANRGEDFYK